MSQKFWAGQTHDVTPTPGNEMPNYNSPLMGYAGTAREPFVTSGWEDTINHETTPAADKNTPENLKTLRWSIYELIDNYQADYGKTIAGCLKQEVERLFREYTNS